MSMIEGLKSPLELSLFDLCTVYLMTKGKLPSASDDHTSFVKELTHIAKTHPRLVAASAEVRKYYEPCHMDCHADKVQAYVRNGHRWPAGAGPFQQKPQLVKTQQG